MKPLEPPFIFADKPAGVATHSPEAGPQRSEGFVEFLSRISGRELFVCHRLDKDTTGAMVFATDREFARELGELFARHEVQKTYLFLTDRALSESIGPSTTAEFTVRSVIRKEKGAFVSFPETAQEPANAITHFHYMKTENGRHLWRAKPQTGKPHQIRLHAADIGIPILGDREHGGSTFPSLMLHSWQLRFNHPRLGEQAHLTTPPALMMNPGLASDPQLGAWLVGLDRRQRLYSESLKDPTGTLRLLHTDGGPLRADRLGPLLWLSWFGDEAPTDRDLERIRLYVSQTGMDNWILQHRLNRGRQPHEAPNWSAGSIPERWTAQEDGVHYEFRSDSGLSSGLFLDQRANRRWVRNHSAERSVLNLFCYTAGFSVCAALGGARDVTSVDTSRATLDWARRGFELNGLDPASFEFRAMDAREYLKWAKKKERRFDLIICDPPSFARSKEGIFRIEKDLPRLISDMAALLAPGGRLLFSTNYENWTPERFKKHLQDLIRQEKMPLSIEDTPPADWDFELPRELPILKSVFLVARS